MYRVSLANRYHQCVCVQHDFVPPSPLPPIRPLEEEEEEKSVGGSPGTQGGRLTKEERAEGGRGLLALSPLAAVGGCQPRPTVSPSSLSLSRLQLREEHHQHLNVHGQVEGGRRLETDTHTHTAVRRNGGEGI